MLVDSPRTYATRKHHNTGTELQPNPELAKQFDWLSLYKNKTLWWSRRTLIRLEIWYGKLTFLATMRTISSQTSVNIFHPIVVDVRKTVRDGYIPSGKATISVWNQILNRTFAPWIHSVYIFSSTLKQIGMACIPLLPAEGAWNWASGKRLPRCVTRMTPGPLQAWQALQASKRPKWCGPIWHFVFWEQVQLISTVISKSCQFSGAFYTKKFEVKWLNRRRHLSEGSTLCPLQLLLGYSNIHGPAAQQKHITRTNNPITYVHP